MYDFQVGSTLVSAAPGGSMMLTTCQEGQQTPFKMAHRTRHLTGGETLYTDKAGNLVWIMNSIPSSGGLNHLRIAFVPPKSGPIFCVHVSVQGQGGVLPLRPLVFDATVNL